MSAKYVVTANVANWRAATTRSAVVLKGLKKGEEITVTHLQQGEDVDGENLWAARDIGGFVHLSAIAYVESRAPMPGDELAYMDSVIYGLREQLSRALMVRAVLAQTKPPA